MSEITRPDGTLNDLDGHTHNGRYHSHNGGNVPHNHGPDDPGWRGAGRIIIGAVLAVVGAAGLWLPWLMIRGGVYSVSQAHSLCDSGLGQFAQALDAQAATSCGQVGAGFDLLWLALVAGLVLAVAGFIARGKR